MTENYTPTFTQVERDAAEKLDEFFGTGWPETTEKKVTSFPNLPKKKKGLLLEFRKPFSFSRIGCGGPQRSENATP